MNKTKYPRIFLWASHRSLSTAFFRAMECRNDIKGMVEPYSLAYFFGPDRRTFYFDGKNVYPDTSMKEQFMLVESLASESCPVFIKDLAVYVMCRENPMSYIPNGFINTFLFRDPRKSYRSCYRMLTQVSEAPLNQIEKLFQENNLFSVKYVWKLYKLIKKSQREEKELLVIDSDDFLENPDNLMRSYCAHVGLEYQDSMLKWGDKSDTIVAECVWNSWFGDALNSKTIDKTITDTNSKIKDLLPDFIENAIDNDMKYYRKLLAVKFRL